MRFVSDFAAIYHEGPTASADGPVFSAHSWLYCRRNIGYQAALSGHAAAVFGAERAGRRGGRSASAHRPQTCGKQGTDSNDYRIASARPRGRTLTAALRPCSRPWRWRSPRPRLRSSQKPARQNPRRKNRRQTASAAGAAPQPAQPQQQAAQRQPQLMYSPWMKVCGKGQDTNNKEVCVVTKDGRLENGMPVAIVQLFEPEGEPKVLRVTVPLGMQLQHGTRMIIDQGQPANEPYKICFPIGCMSDYPVTDDMVAS